jgi:hypothetical protein
VVSGKLVNFLAGLLRHSEKPTVVGVVAGRLCLSLEECLGKLLLNRLLAGCCALLFTLAAQLLLQPSI